MLVARHTGHRILMPPRSVSTERLTRALVGQEVARAIADGSQKFAIHFASGITLVINADSEELIVTLSQPKLSAPKGTAQRPTKRQLEYLSFIAKYMARFGRAPAESDIERHFLVSAPSVNQMMQTLERCGYITRQRGVARSLRLCIALPQSTGALSH